MTATLDWREELKSTARKSKPDHPRLVERLLQSQRKLAKQHRRMGLEKNWQAETDAKKKLAEAYYSTWLAGTYPVVDLSFASGKINLLIERTKAGARLIGTADREPVAPYELVATVQRFAKQASDGRRDMLGPMPDPKCRLGTFTFPTFQRNRDRFREFTGNVNCNRPVGSPQSLQKRLLDIAAIALEARAAAIRGGASIAAAEFGRTFLWLPKLEDLYIEKEIPVRDDPAVLVTVGDRAHLVAFWDSPNEDPIEGLLREFSDGPFVDED